MLTQGILELDADEFATPVGLDALDGKGKLAQHSRLEEVDGIGSGASRVKAQDTHPGAIINGGELVEVASHLAGVYLHAVARNWTGVAFGLPGARART